MTIASCEAAAGLPTAGAVRATGAGVADCRCTSSTLPSATAGWPLTAVARKDVAAALPTAATGLAAGWAAAVGTGVPMVRPPPTL